MQLESAHSPADAALGHQRIEHMKKRAKAPRKDHRIWSNEVLLHLQKPAATGKLLAEVEKTFLQRIHWMRCPTCGHRLQNEYRGPAKVLACANCHGLWLDADQLEVAKACGGPLADMQQQNPQYVETQFV